MRDWERERIIMIFLWKKSRARIKNIIKKGLKREREREREIRDKIEIDIDR